MKNIGLLVVVVLIFWHVFLRKGSTSSPHAAPSSPPPGPDQAPPANTDHNSLPTGDVETTERTP